MRRPGNGRRLPMGAALFAVVLLPLGLWLSYNATDRELLPAAAAQLDAKPQPVPDADNLFLALLAFPIGGDEPAHERGAAALAAYERAQRAKPDPQLSYAGALDRAVARLDTDTVAALCSAGNHADAYHCLRNSRARRESLAGMFAQLQPLLVRYRELQHYPRYADTRAPALETPLADPTAFRIGLLHLSAMALAMEEGARVPAVDQLVRSALIWRRVLGAKDVSLIDKMLASRALMAHSLFASELIRTAAQLTVPELDALQLLLAPMEVNERSLGDALRREFQTNAHFWNQVADPQSPIVRHDFPTVPGWAYGLLIKRNDSLNRAYQDLDRVLALDRASCAEVAAAMKADDARASADEPPSLPWSDYFYNPLGRSLQQMISNPAELHGYLGQQCNLLTLQRAVSVQLALRRRGKMPADLSAAILREAAPDLIDPVSGKPFVLDAAQGTLSLSIVGKDRAYLTPLPLREP